MASDPIARYNCADRETLFLDSDGPFVAHEDYAALEAKVERLREAARDLLAVAADAIKDGVPLYPDQVPELEALNRAALAGEAQDGE